MGLGAIGSQVAQAVAAAGYPTAGWSRSARHIDGVQTFGGSDQFASFLARTRVLVNVLPLTPDTESILNRENLQQRSEEHTSELQSLMRISYAVFCLKKKKTIKKHYYNQLDTFIMYI